MPHFITLLLLLDKTLSAVAIKPPLRKKWLCWLFLRGFNELPLNDLKSSLFIQIPRGGGREANQ